MPVGLLLVFRPSRMHPWGVRWRTMLDNSREAMAETLDPQVVSSLEAMPRQHYGTPVPFLISSRSDVAVASHNLLSLGEYHVAFPVHIASCNITRPRRMLTPILGWENSSHGSTRTSFVVFGTTWENKSM